MSDQTPSVQDDLAFMRALAQAGGTSFLQRFGQAYFTAGLCYSMQMLLHGAQLGLGWFQTTPEGLTIGLGPTVIYLILLAWLKNRWGPLAGNTVAKAIGAVFGAVGLTSLVLAIVIGSLALRERSIQIWLIFPCVVMALQGMAWNVAGVLRKRPWMGLVGVGWFATAIVMGVALNTPAVYISALGVGIFAFMLIPGAVMMRIFKA